MIDDYQVTKNDKFYMVISSDGDQKRYLRSKVEELADEFEISETEAAILKFIIHRAEICITPSLKVLHMSNIEIIRAYTPVFEFISPNEFENFIEWLEEQPLQVVQYPIFALKDEWS